MKKKSRLLIQILKKLNHLLLHLLLLLLKPKKKIKQILNQRKKINNAEEGPEVHKIDDTEGTISNLNSLPFLSLVFTLFRTQEY